MGLKQQIDSDIKTAMLNRQKEKLIALRAVKSMILLAETEKGKTGELDKEAENKILMKAAKQRKESADIFKSENREDLYKKEMFELEIISRYLPKQLSKNEITDEVKEIVAQVGAKGPQDMGKVMGAATKALAGKADGKTISEIVKQLLSS
ncbi:MAG TPA: GatB/YqeY domain-containing protein [Cyclobacteriaceae bacterium]